MTNSDTVRAIDVQRGDQLIGYFTDAVTVTGTRHDDYTATITTTHGDIHLDWADFVEIAER